VRSFIVILAFILFTVVPVTAVADQGLLTGVVIDGNSGQTMEYANIVLLEKSDSSLITGTISAADGSFLLSDIPFGEYLLEVRFLGFLTKHLEIRLGGSSPSLNLGRINLYPSDVVLDAVVVEGERSAVTYELDKKVLSVDRLPIAASGTAVDALEHLPSVTVDIQGNVTLRGSQSFTVLIDGRPTVLDAQDALQQVPASSIETIEVITNPSAKFDPEGAAGIINVVLKKERRTGLSGIANATAGFEGQYGGDLLLDYRKDAIGLTFGIDHNTRIYPGSTTEQRVTSLGDTVSFYDAAGTGDNRRISSGIRGGVETRLGSSNLLSLSARYGERSFEGSSTIHYNEWSSIDPVQTAFRNENSNERAGKHYSVAASYLHTFPVEGQELSSDISYSYRDSEDFDLTELYSEDMLLSGIRSTEFGPSSEVRGRLDYTMPLGTHTRLETGYEGELDDDEEENGLYAMDSLSSSYTLQPEYSHDTRSLKSEHALYATFADFFSGFGVQGGLRAEYTYRNIEVRDLGERFRIDRLDYFPTLHLSYKFSAEQQLMASYTRRIERPRGWYLEPFVTWTDATNIRRGNPSLQPEFFDSYELGFQTLAGEVSITSELYYRVNNNKIERVRSAYSENITLTTFENIGQDYSFGAEVLLNFDLFSFWDVNLMGNAYHYRIDGVLFDEPFSRESFSWRGRINNIMTLSESTQLQVNAGYQSPTVYSQGRREEVFTTDLAVRQDLLSKTLSLTLLMRNFLGTYTEEVYTEGLDQYSYTTATRKSPMVEFTLRFNFNNYPSEDGRRPDGDGGPGFEE
jgi:outer membrane receptor protein involved in Fe transport